jgi:tetratricopeptide (TPR) repeat protein
MKTAAIIVLLHVVLFSIAQANDRPINELPMYGGQDKSHIQPNAEFSQNASDIGWDYLMNGDVDTAIKRFNQSWMFNHNNVDALWGFGIITLHRGNILKENSLLNLTESVKYLEIAKSIKPEELRLIVDLSLSYIFLGNELKKNNEKYIQYFVKAEKNLNNAITINEDYPMIYANYSILEYYQENYSLSKKYLEKAKSLGFQIDPLFEKKLNEKS